MTLWLTTAEADTYFATRLDVAQWDASGVDKTAALTTGQSQIVGSGKYMFVDSDGVAIPDDEATTEMKFAVCEQALFLLGAAYSEERISLIAQNVTEAGVVGEEYAGMPGGAGIIIAPMANMMLRGFDTGSSQFPITK